MNELKIEDLYVAVDDKMVLKGINLTIKKGSVHVLMGPNGAGKSCLANTLMGNPKYKINSGKIILDGVDITMLSPDKRAKLGLFLSFQYPHEISGVSMSNFLRTAYNSLKEDKKDVMEFNTLIKEKMDYLGMDKSFSKRHLNVGFSGGEKKRSEILQMSILNPKYCILDECDSGLDINSIKIVGEEINKMKSPERCILIITHYNRILDYLQPDVVSVMLDGKIVQTGKLEILEKIEKEGFSEFYK